VNYIQVLHIFTDKEISRLFQPGKFGRKISDFAGLRGNPAHKVHSHHTR